MEGYEPQTYGEAAAPFYDQWHGDLPDTEACLERLAELAGAGPALELGVGTGRLAIPLAERGVAVHGIDASAAMLERLRAKPGGERVRTTLGDMVEVGADGVYQLVFVAVNTLFMLPSQDDQVRCFANVAKRLADGGLFVVEAQVPEPRRMGDANIVRVLRVTTDSLVLAAGQYDPVTQQLTAHHVLLTDDGVRLVPGVLRWSWPTELDLMARLAGLRLRERWGGWRREPFTAASTSHVSLYEPA